MSHTLAPSRLPSRRALLALFLALVGIALLPLSDAHAGVNRWTGSGPEGGFIEAIALDPNDPDVLFAGTAYGSLWWSDDAGDSWRLVDTIGFLNSVTDIEFGAGPSPVVLVGASTLLWSADGGETWEEGSGFDGSIRAIAAHPADPLVAYAGTSAGVFKSLDGGASWSPATSGLQVQQGVTDLAIDPIDPETVYATTTTAGIFKTTNGGESWEPVNTGIDTVNLWSVAIDPNDTQVLYAGAPSHLYKSVNGGGDWDLLTSTIFVQSIEVAPSNSQVLYIAADGSGVYKSVNGGDEWDLINTGFARPSAEDLAIHPDDEDTVYNATRADGVYKTTNGGASWVQRNTGLAATDVENVILTTGGLLAATFGDGVHKGGDAGWEQASEGLLHLAISAMAGAPSDPSVAYAGMWAWSQPAQGIYRTADGGASWQPAGTGMNDSGVTVLAVHPEDPDHALVGALDKGIFYTLNGGAGWDQPESGPGEQEILAVAFGPDGTAYAGTYEGIYVSADGGANWEMTPATPSNPEVRSFAPDPNDSQRVYAGTYTGLFRTSNGGESWQMVLPGGIRDVATLASPETVVFAADSTTVWRSTDGGSTWVQLPQVEMALLGANILDLLVEGAGPVTLHVATQGGGVFSFTVGPEAHLFEGWNELAWHGVSVEGAEEIVQALDKAVQPVRWTAIARFTKTWLVTYSDAPLPTFNTLTAVESGEDHWLFSTGEADIFFPQE